MPFDIKRVARLTVALALVAGSGYSQKQDPDAQEQVDPHENPVIQNSGTTAPVPQAPAPKIKKSLKTASKPVVPEPPALETETAIIGTWDLIPAKSKFDPAPGPKAEVRIYEKTSDGIVAKVKTTDMDGKERTVSYPWHLDGSEATVTGSPLLDTIQLKKVDNLTDEATYKHGETVIASERREIALDGKTMSITIKDTSSGDKPVSSVAVYERR
jgi:hypothetical protein